MKAQFTKAFFGIMAMICLLLNSNLIFAQAQWVSSNNFSALNAATYNETLKVTNTGGSVGGGNVVRGDAINSTGDILAPAGYGGISNAWNIVPTAQLFKASAGKPFTITLEFDLGNAFFGSSESTITMLQSGLGKNEQNYAYDQYITIPQTSVVTDNPNNRRKYTFTGTYTFPVGRTRAWLVFGFRRTIGPANSTSYAENIIVLPFVVEGAFNDISAANPVQIKGYTKEPAIPYMILHNPPGDNSTVTFATNQEACRTFTETASDDISNSGFLDVKLGIAGSTGLFVTVNFEFSVTASASAGGGSAAIKTKEKQNCVSTLSAISTAPNSGGANNGSIFLGYATDLAYGFFPTVKIIPGISIIVKRDTSLIFAPIASTPFYWTKQQIIDDISVKQVIVNNPTNSLELRNNALNQIKLWRQVLDKDSINVNNPNNVVLSPTFDLAGRVEINDSKTVSTSLNNSYDVTHYIEASAGVKAVINIGGSGVEGGYEFKTRKSFGQNVANSTNSSTTIAYRLYDDDQGDLFKVKIVRDPDYGTPIFLTSLGTKSSWPYEGGYQRDQPELRFTAAPTSSNYTVPNVAVGQPSIFGINLCNNSNEPRTYNMRFNPLSNPNGANIAISGTTGNTEFGSFPVAANSCYPSTFFATVTQGNPAALSSQDLNLQLYSFNDQAIASDIFATCNWGNYALPTSISTGQINICQGLSANVSLSATCATGTVATWYNSPTAIAAIGTGNPFVQSPTVNNNYFVSCNSGIYNYKRFSANSVSINPIPSVPIISASGPLTFCNAEAMSVILKSYLPNNNALTFVKTSNQYVIVPHSASINLGANFTMEAWVNYSGSNLTIIDKGNYDFLWQLDANNNGNKMGFYYAGTSGWVYSTGSIPQNTWTHVAITLQGGILTFYINGMASGTAAVASAAQDAQSMNIGRQQPTACACNHFNGTMDELRLWNYARTPSQILANLNSVPSNTYGLVAYYKFDETTGTTIADASGNNNTGTFLNDPTRQIPSTVPSNVVNALWTPTNTTAPSITATALGTYTATVTNGFGCTNSASVVTSMISPTPTPQVYAYYIPAGGSASLTATGCSGATGTYSLRWSKVSDNSLVTMPVSPTTTTSYYVSCERALDGVGCLSLVSANVTVNVGNYINSIISGNWENSNTWTPSRIPLPTDIVIINNHTVTISSNAANAKSLEYKSGATLRYLNAVAKLNVGL